MWLDDNWCGGLMFAVCCFPALVIVMSGYTQRQEFGELEKADLTFQHHHHYM